MRINTRNQLENLKREGSISTALYKRLAAEFALAEDASTTRTSAPKTRHSSKFKGVQSERDKRASQCEFCYFPELIFDSKDIDPEVLLYRAAARRWGRAYEGGEAVYQLTIRNPRSYSVDVALPRYRIAIEVDGYTHHSGLDSFKRDHDKAAQLAEIGWLIMRAGNELIKNEAMLNKFLDRVEMACRHRESGEWATKRFPGTKKRASFNSMLTSWRRTHHAVTDSYQYEKG